MGCCCLENGIELNRGDEVFLASESLKLKTKLAARCVDDAFRESGVWCASETKEKKNGESVGTAKGKCKRIRVMNMHSSLA